MQSPEQTASFLFITCQVGADNAVKAEISLRWPNFRFAYSRPGFLTFRLPEQQYLTPDFNLGSVFARAFGFSLGKVASEDPALAAKAAWELLGDRPIRQIHVWERDRAEPGLHSFEPSITPAAVAAYESLRATSPQPDRLAPGDHLRQQATPGDWVADCILLEPNTWWLGYHRARSVTTCWPGGIPNIDAPNEVVSRAWAKMEEALRWSHLPAAAGARFAEIGSSPGGASQALLVRGFEVIGIDPAEMAQQVVDHPRFRHIRRRASEVPRRAFRKVRWLTADMNVAPNFALDAVEAIVSHPQVSIRGMLLTLKLPDWKLAWEVPAYLARIRTWGFNVVRARQLAHNRQEICIAALKKPFQRKPPV
jgi:23S rRNA (cytidine2498-2'-O)-methyltransferase